MYKLIIFAITMLLLSSICNGQGRTSFGAGRAQDTSFTVGQLKLNAYSGSEDTMDLVVLPNGQVKKVERGGGDDVDLDTLQYYQYVFNVDAFGATPYWVDSTDDDTRDIQQAILAVAGDREIAFDTVTGYATVLNVGIRTGGIVTGNGEYDLRRRLVKGIYYIKDGDTTFRPCNSQLYFPYVHFPHSGGSLESPVGIKLQGNSFASWNESAWAESYSSGQKTGFILHSRITNDGSTYPSVLASPVGDTLSVGGSPMTLNNVDPELENVWVRVNHLNTTGNQLCGIDFFQHGWFRMDGCRVDGDTSGIGSVEPAYRVFGIRSQRTSTGTLGLISNSIVTTGFKYGIIGQEHVQYNNTNVFLCYYAFEQSGNARPTEFRNVLAQWNKHVLHTGDFITIANGEGNVMGDLSVEKWEGAAYWFKAADTSIVDSLDYLRGHLTLEIFGTLCGLCDTFLRAKGATELVQSNPYVTGNTVGYILNRGSFKTNDGHILMQNNGYVDINVGGAAPPAVSGPNPTSAGSRFLLDSRFATIGLGINDVGNNIITWHHLGGVLANNGLVYSNDDGVGVTNIDSMSGTGERFFIGASNINKSTYRIAVIDTANRNKVGWRTPLQLYADGLTVPTASGSALFNFNNEATFMGQMAITGSTYSQQAIAPNSILFYSHLPAGKLQFMANGASGAFEVYTAGIAAANLRLSVNSSGNLSLYNKIIRYNNAAPTNGQLLIGHTANGTFEAATLTAGTGIDITNGAGAITVATNGNATVTTTSAGTLSPSASGHYVFTGTTSTWTLPVVSGTSGRVMFIKNRGSGTVTINAAAAANEIYSNAAVNTYALTAGSAIILVSDGTFFNIE